MTTFELGLTRTCRRPRFSAFEIVLRQSANTDMRTICAPSTGRELRAHKACKQASDPSSAATRKQRQEKQGE
jgi:hypothetical protein